MDKNLIKSLETLDQAAEELLNKSELNVDKEDNSQNGDDLSKGKDCKDDDLNKSDDNDIADKSDDNDSGDDSEDDSDNDDSGDDSDDEEETKKSLSDFQQNMEDNFQADDDIAQGVQSSEFQAAVVASLAKALGEIQYDIYTNSKANGQISSIFAKSMKVLIDANQSLRAENDKLSRRVNKLEKSFNSGFDSLIDAIDSLSVQPAHSRKSVSSINVHDRDFNKSLNGAGGVSDFDSLSKSQVMDVLNNELYSGNQSIRPADIIAFESGAPLRPELKTLVVNKCK